MPPKPSLSLFLAYCPDRVAAGIVEARLAARADHFAMFAKDQAAGRAEFGRAILPPPDSPLRGPEGLAKLPPNVQPMGGSVMLLRCENLERAWERVKTDPYWVAGVWDPETTRVEEFCAPPPAGTVAGVDATAVGGTGSGIA